MAKTAAARVNTIPRVLTKLSDKQERFARHYAVSGDAEEALRYAGYSVSTPETVSTTRSRLLANHKIKCLVDEIRAKIASEHGMDRDGVMNRLKTIYLQACEDRDWNAAANTLDKLAKCFGAYEQHNKQKKYSPDDVAAIKARLEEQGVDFREINKPVELTDKKNGFVEVKQLPAPVPNAEDKS